MVLVLEWLEWQRLVSGFLFKRLPCIACPMLQIWFSYDFRLFLDANMAEAQAIPSSLVANVISWLGDRLWLGDWVGKSAGKSFLESKLLGLQMFELPWLHNHDQLAPVCCCWLSIQIPDEFSVTLTVWPGLFLQKFSQKLQTAGLSSNFHCI